MTTNTDFSMLLIAMGLSTVVCRFGGFMLMRFVTVTPRIEAALRATPLAVMVGMITPAAISGKVPEIAGLVVAIGLMRLTRSDLFAGLSGVAVVAMSRYFGFH